MGKKMLSVLVLTVLLCSCEAMSRKYTKVILKHPETLEFKECQVGIWATDQTYRDHDECVKKYEAQGYEVWGER